MDGRARLPTGFLLAGDYRIEKELGAGGFGITYKAEDVRLGVAVAIKEYIPAAFGSRSAGTMDVGPLTKGHGDLFDWGRRRFLEEASNLARLKHPNIVSVLRFFEINNTAYIALAYEEGVSLGDWLKSLGRRPTQAELDGVVTPLLDALATLHRGGLMHRDLSPDNIIIRPDGSPVLLDFGAARRAVVERSQVMTAIVKDGFSPPEQYSRDPTTQGTWSDIYAFGCIIYLAILGERPLPAPDRQLGKEMEPLAGRPDLAEYRPAFLAGIDRAMLLKPRERPATVRELRELITDPEAPRSETRPPVLTHSQLASEKTVASAPRRGRAVAAVLGLLLIAGAGVGAAALYSGYLQPPTLPPEPPRKEAAKSGVSGTLGAVDTPGPPGPGDTNERQRREAEERLRREAEERQRREADERQRREAEERLRREAEERQRREADERQRREADERQRVEAEDRQRREAEDRQRREAEDRQRREAEDRQRREAEDRQRREADERQRREAEEQRQRREAEEQRQRREAEDRQRREAEERQRAAGAASDQDGRYTGAISGCGEPIQHGIIMRIAGGRVDLVHRLQGIDYQWAGSIDPAGAIQLSVGGNTAFAGGGRLAELALELRYPQCATPLVFRIRNRTPN